jgi:hypothetical protein
MTNDTVVFDAMRFDIRIGQYVWIAELARQKQFSATGFSLRGCLNIARTNGSMARREGLRRFRTCPQAPLPANEIYARA